MPRHPDAVVTRNDLLKAARLRLQSPRRPGQRMNRPELADAVNAELDRANHDRRKIDHLYVDYRWIGKLERGETRWPHEKRRAALRHVLHATTDDDLGLYSPRITTQESTGAARASFGSAAIGNPAVRASGRDVAAVRRAESLGRPFTTDGHPATAASSGPARYASNSPSSLAGPLVAALNDVPVPGVELVDLRTLSTQVAATRSAYQQSRYGRVVSAIPMIVSQVRARSLEIPDDARVANRLASETYQVTSGLLLKFDEPVQAAVAADRSLASALTTEDPIAIASAARAVTHSVMAAGHPRQAAAIAIAAAERLRRDAKAVDLRTISVHGALLLRAATAAAQADERDQALALLDEAEVLAADVGHDSNAYWTAFGPTNVSLHRVAISVQLGDAGTAVHIGSTIDARRLPVAERRAMLHLDLARAYIQWGRHEPALRHIAMAEGNAVEEVRSRPASVRLLQELAQRCPSAFRGKVDRYAHRIGILSE